MCGVTRNETSSAKKNANKCYSSSTCLCLIEKKLIHKWLLSMVKLCSVMPQDSPNYHARLETYILPLMKQNTSVTMVHFLATYVQYGMALTSQPLILSKSYKLSLKKPKKNLFGKYLLKDHLVTGNY